MLVPLSILSTLALLVQSIDAARLPFESPGSPRSSVQGATELKDVFRQRQARSADVVRRLRQGPNRKRQDPSAAAMCSIPSGTNGVQNPGFESGQQPWAITRSRLMRAFLAGGYGYQSTTGFYVRSVDSTQTVTAIIQQDLTVCAGVQFSLLFDIGRATDTETYNGAECSLVVTIEGVGFRQTMYADSPCASGACIPQQADDGYSYATFETSIDFTAEQAASPVTFKAAFTCPPTTENGDISKFYLLDNVVLTRASQQ